MSIHLQIVEFDALLVVQAINENSEYLSEFGDLILDASHLLSLFTEGAVIQHVYRSANNYAAHD